LRAALSLDQSTEGSNTRQGEIAQATAKSEEARKDIAAAGVRIAESEQATAELTAKNLVLEAASAPKRLSDRQQKELAALMAFAGRTIGIKSYLAMQRATSVSNA